jgi:hypothetical protein
MFERPLLTDWLAGEQMTSTVRSKADLVYSFIHSFIRSFDRFGFDRDLEFWRLCPSTVIF